MYTFFIFNILCTSLKKSLIQVTFSCQYSENAAISGKPADLNNCNLQHYQHRVFSITQEHKFWNLFTFTKMLHDSVVQNVLLEARII